MPRSCGRPLNASAAFIHPCQPIVAKQPYLMLYSFSTNRIEPVPRFTWMP